MHVTHVDCMHVMGKAAQAQRKARAAELKACLPKLFLETVWKENAVFSRLLYKRKNQFKSDKSFQMLTGVSCFPQVYVPDIAITRYF